MRLTTDRDPWKIIVDAFGVAGQVVTQLEEQGVEVHRVSGGEHAEAVGVLMEEVTEETLRHLGSSELLDAVRGREAAVDGRRLPVVAQARQRRHLAAGRRVARDVGARGMPEDTDMNIW